MSPFIAHLITRVSITVTCVLLLLAALTIELRDDIPRVVCANASLAECNVVQNDSHK